MMEMRTLTCQRRATAPSLWFDEDKPPLVFGKIKSYLFIYKTCILKSEIVDSFLFTDVRFGGTVDG